MKSGSAGSGYSNLNRFFFFLHPSVTHLTLYSSWMTKKKNTLPVYSSCFKLVAMRCHCLSDESMTGDRYRYRWPQAPPSPLAHLAPASVGHTLLLSYQMLRSSTVRLSTGILYIPLLHSTFIDIALSSTPLLLFTTQPELRGAIDYIIITTIKKTKNLGHSIKYTCDTEFRW
jgi:hypothetical protein